MKILALAAALLPLAPFASTAADSPVKRPPNIVLIVIDDMGWKDIAANGSTYYKTPNVDRLASEGMRFRNGYAACAVCSPSRAAIMTGQSPARLHLTDWIPGEGAPKNSRFTVPQWDMTLEKSTPTLPQLLKKQGYTTAAIGKWHLGNDGPEAHGFDVNIAGGHIGHPASFFWPYGKEGNSHRVPMLAEAGGKEGEYLTDRLTDEAVKFIDGNRDKPFFLYLAHYAVHAPLMAKDDDTALFKGAKPDGQQDFPVYAGMVKAVDDSVGRILADLKKQGLEDNTIVVFTSDNGGVVHFRATDNAPLRGGKGFPYEGGLRVPFIVRAPGLTKPGSVNDTPVIGTDFLPTFAKLAGIEGKPAPVLDGVDISPALRGGKLERDTFLWHYPHYWWGGNISPYSVIHSGDWKLVRWNEYGSEELYNLAQDPSEKTDLAKANPEKLKEMSAKLDAELKAQDAQPPVPRKDAKAAPDPESNPAKAAKFIRG
ncbi:sulfatase [Luteolibacter sp. LG18]|uniref:sulfatase n=1 Tax=Luteolibacter sp. LG18 TaxID=2819286 RepID=UPI002B2F4B59|nr:sulfatase [Luteolibacter sp. LG18]